MEFLYFLAGSLSATVLLGLLVFLSKTWLEARIALSIQHEYDKKLGEHQRQNEIRTRAELISELMAEWIEKDADRKRLNQLSFQAFLWLPADLAQDLSKTLSHKPDAPNLREIIIKARRHLLSGDDSLQPVSVIVFPRKGDA